MAEPQHGRRAQSPRGTGGTPPPMQEPSAPVARGGSSNSLLGRLFGKRGTSKSGGSPTPSDGPSSAKSAPSTPRAGEPLTAPPGAATTLPILAQPPGALRAPAGGSAGSLTKPTVASAAKATGKVLLGDSGALQPTRSISPPPGAAAYLTSTSSAPLPSSAAAAAITKPAARATQLSGQPPSGNLSASAIAAAAAHGGPPGGPPNIGAAASQQRRATGEHAGLIARAASAGAGLLTGQQTTTSLPPGALTAAPPPPPPSPPHAPRALQEATVPSTPISGGTVDESPTSGGATACCPPFSRPRGSSFQKPPALVCEFAPPTHQQRPSLIAALHGGGGGAAAATAADIDGVLAEAEGAMGMPLGFDVTGDTGTPLGGSAVPETHDETASPVPPVTPGSATAVAAKAAAARAALAVAIGEGPKEGRVTEGSEAGAPTSNPAAPTEHEPRFHSAEGGDDGASKGAAASHDGFTSPPAARPGVDEIQAMPQEQRRIESLGTHVDAARRHEEKVKRLRDAEAAAGVTAAPTDTKHGAGPAQSKQQQREPSPTLYQDDYEKQRAAAAVAAVAKPAAAAGQLQAPAKVAGGIKATAALESTAAASSPAGLSAGAGTTAGTTPARPRRAYKLLSVHPLLHPSLRREFWASEQFEVTKRLHKGYASEVYKAIDKQSGEICAVKVYDVTQLGKLNKAQLIREIKLHGSFAHRNIVDLYCSFQEGNQVALVQHYCSRGDLLRLIQSCGGRMNERAAIQVVIHPLLSVLLYLHARGVTHRDIKPENILFDEDGILKLADFGLAINTNDEPAVTRAGTLHYMAPEVLVCPLKDHPDENKEVKRLHYTSSVDAWAVGCLAYELTVGFPPFIADKTADITERIQRGIVHYPSKMSEEQRDFVQWALQRTPGDRPTVAEMLQHPWIKLHQRRNSSRNLGGGSGDGSASSALSTTTSSSAYSPRGGSASAASKARPAAGGGGGEGGAAGGSSVEAIGGVTMAASGLPKIKAPPRGG